MVSAMAVEALRIPLMAEVELQVPFHDLDPLQVVWHGNYLKYFEIARDALFAQRGLNLVEYFRERGTLFPVIRTSTKHVHPLRYGDRFLCVAELVEARVKLVVSYSVRLIADGQLCARGRTEQVAVDAEALSLELSIPLDVRRAFGID